MNSREGGNERFEAIYRRFYARVWRYFRACRVTDDEAHDLAQDSFKRLFERMTQIRGEDEWPFLQSIARSVFLNWLRGRKTQKRDSGRVVDLDDPDYTDELPSVEPPDHAANEEEARRRGQLRDAIAQLPLGQQQCMELWLEQLTYEEIAKSLRVSDDAVKSRIRDAKRTLSSRLGDTLPEERE